MPAPQCGLRIRVLDPGKVYPSEYYVVYRGGADLEKNRTPKTL